MKLTQILLLTSAFCISILIAINKDTVTKNQFIGGADKLNGPEEFELFHKSIRTPDDANSPQYKPGFINNELRKSRQLAQARKLSGARTQSNGVIEWVSRGPNNVPGRTRGLIVDPDDPEKNTWYAGSAGGGVWKTVNGGINWTLITPDLTNLATTVLGMANSNRNIIYLGTGEGFGNVDRVRGHGMYKSIDRGVSWSYLPTTSEFGDVNRLTIDPNNENIVVVATSTGIYKSIDGGFDWIKTLDKPGIQDLKSTPNNFSIQYAAQNSVGVFKSTDGGSSWQLSNSGIDPEGRIELAVSPAVTSTVFSSVEGSKSGSESDLYISKNSGATWEIVNVVFDNKAVDFLGGQGWYDNTIACDPFNANVVYVGGVNLFRVELMNGYTSGTSYSVQESNTDFIELTPFINATNGNFSVGTAAGNVTIEIRFGDGKSQKAHRFLVPEGSTSGVPDASYVYTDYVNVPFEAWDVTNNKQLMVSFRDQDRNGAFNLKYYNTSGAPLEQSREYVYVNNINYNAQTPNSTIASAGGHLFQQMYNIWPVLAPGKIWPDDIVDSKLIFIASNLPKLAAETIIASDAYNDFDGKNRFVNYGVDIHPDQHNITMISGTSGVFRILIANDGGIFLSNLASAPGINQGNWSMRGLTYNTSQFYGADKRPGFDEYFGGMQDNGTWKSPPGTSANASSSYSFKLGGDGFEVIWNNLNDLQLIGGSQRNNFSRSLDGGATWTAARAGLSGNHPFISKLANSKDNPDLIYTVSTSGVFRSTDFGGSWSLTPITDKWVTSTTTAPSFIDVEVSRSNATIVWAGSGMSNTGTLRTLHVSTDEGLTFTPTNNYTDVTLGSISKLASHPFEPSTAYALFSFSGKPKVLRTQDLGENWEDISGFGVNDESNNGFPDVAVYCLYVRTDNPDIIWVGTEIGIVESLDNGQTWNIIEDFPNVSVWDMKGQDNQVVIATHGRGIWTANLEVPQRTITLPEIIASGTAPNKDLMLKIKSSENFDRIEMYESNQLIGTVTDVIPSELVIPIRELSPGIKKIKLVAFKGTAPFHTQQFSINHLALSTPADSYATYFTNATDFSMSLLSLQKMPDAVTGERTTLQSNHPYNHKAQATMIILTPIKISGTFPLLQYEDIALVEPGVEGVAFGEPDFKDYVIVEATKNGLDWIPLSDGYDARKNQKWFDAYTASALPTKAFFVNHEVNLTDKFEASDTVLIRYRMYSNATVNGWGWAVNFVAIQQLPTGVESPSVFNQSLSVYPNPTQGSATIAFEIDKTSFVDLRIIDGLGRTRSVKNLGMLAAGNHTSAIQLDDDASSVYFVVVKTQSESKTITLVRSK